MQNVRLVTLIAPMIAMTIAAAAIMAFVVIDNDSLRQAQARVASAVTAKPAQFRQPSTIYR